MFLTVPPSDQLTLALAIFSGKCWPLNFDWPLVAIWKGRPVDRSEYRCIHMYTLRQYRMHQVECVFFGNMWLNIWIEFLTIIYMQELKFCPVLFVIMIHNASWNINGLNTPIKCSTCLDWLKWNQMDVDFIKSHILNTNKQCLLNCYYCTSAAATFTSKSRGDLAYITLNKCCPDTLTW